MAVLLAFAAPALAAEQTFTAPGVVVTYTGIGEAYAKAIGQTVSAARAMAVTRFGFDMPEKIRVYVTCGQGQELRLFNDGQDMFRLSIPSEKDLQKPATTGTFHLYGLCHEVGHLAQYRPIRTHDWMTSECAEGWAHYLGSRLVDLVYAQEGGKLWPDVYDYRADGMARLKAQLAEGDSGKPTGAGLWVELAEIAGDRGIAPIFAAWGRVKVDSAEPGPALGGAVPGAKSNKRLAEWWKKAESVLIAKRAKSQFTAKTVAPKALRGRPVELKHDDGAAANKASLAGGGHAARFEAPGEDCYLLGVSLHGTRYGGQPPKDEKFHVWLCDEKFRPVADFALPYAALESGSPKWVRLPIPPTLVPAKFIVCVGFNPTASRGFFLDHDAAGSGQSLCGLPGKDGTPFDKGDWMIRATVDQSKTARAPKR